METIITIAAILGAAHFAGFDVPDHKDVEKKFDKHIVQPIKDLGKNTNDSIKDWKTEHKF